MIPTIFLWTVKKILTKAFYKKIMLIVVDKGIGAIVKRTDNDIDDAIHAAIVEALKKAD